MIFLIVFLPLFAAAVVGLTTRVISVRTAHMVTCGAMVLSALLATLVFAEFAQLATAHEGWQQLAGPSGLVYKIHVAPWITSGDLTAGWLLRVDALTAVMLLVVT